MKFKLITYIDRVNYLSDVFLKFYLKTFSHDEFHFLILEKDFDSISNYLKENGFNEKSFESLKRNKFGFGENIKKQNEIKKKFINEGFIVVYADIDELIYHPNLKEYVNSSKKYHFRPIGVNIIQDSNELPIDINHSVLSQRRKIIINNEWYSKVCILKKDYMWTSGRHNNLGVEMDNNLILFDLGKICKNITLYNNKQNKELYDFIFERYQYTDINKIEKEYSRFENRIIDIEELLQDTTIF